MTDHHAIDLWVNVNMGAGIPVEYLQLVKEDYFKGGDEFFTSLTIDETIAQMDEASVEKAVLSTSVRRPEETVLELCRERPDRFSLAAYVRPTKGMKELWALEDLLADHPVLPMKGCIDEAEQLDLREGVLDKFLRTNAERFFFSERKPRRG